MIKVTRKSLLAWLSLVAHWTKSGITKEPEPAYEPLSYKQRDDDAERARKDKRRAK